MKQRTAGLTPEWQEEIYRNAEKLTPAERATTAQSAIESLLISAKCEGLKHRQPHRLPEPLETGKRVAYFCTVLDSLGVNFTMQNQALEYINSSDTARIWDKLYSNSLDTLARAILSGEPATA